MKSEKFEKSNEKFGISCCGRFQKRELIILLWTAILFLTRLAYSFKQKRSGKELFNWLISEAIMLTSITLSAATLSTLCVSISQLGDETSLSDKSSE